MESAIGGLRHQIPSRARSCGSKFPVPSAHVLGVGPSFHYIKKNKIQKNLPLRPYPILDRTLDLLSMLKQSHFVTQCPGFQIVGHYVRTQFLHQYAWYYDLA